MPLRVSVWSMRQLGEVRRQSVRRLGIGQGPAAVCVAVSDVQIARSPTTHPKHDFLARPSQARSLSCPGWPDLLFVPGIGLPSPTQN